MVEDQSFPERAWRDICAAYRDEALSSCCLALQDRHEVDVPLLLLLAVAERAGRYVAASELDGLIDDAAGWREVVIVPLRKLRRAMKGRFSVPAEQKLRDEVKALELDAERLHVTRLATALLAAGGGGEAGNVFRYLASRRVPEAKIRKFLNIFAAADAAAATA